MIACANVANLSLARAARRLHEFGLRSALGAKRGQLVSLLLTENLLIAGGGALAGVIFARAALDLFLGELQKEAALTGGMPASLNFEVDGLVLAFVSILTIATALASGVVPALRVTGMSLEHLIRGGGRSTTLRSGRFGKVLIQVQLAASVLLLIGTGVMGSIWAQMGSKVQYDPSKILSARIELPQTQFTTPERRGVFFQTLETELKASTMIEAAALSTAEHIERTSSTGVVLEGTRSDRASDAMPAKWQAVSPGFFEVFRSSLRGGRLLSNQDSAGSLPVAVVNQSFLRRNWSNSDPIGKRFRWTAPNGEVQWLTVVGVVEDMGSLKAVADANAAAFYVPLAQTDATEVGIVMRTRGEASAAIPAVREVLRNQTTVPLFQIHTAQQIMEMEAVGIRVPALLFAVCGISGLLLSAVGTYGVLSLSARQRTREMGIRLALGATPKVLFRSLMVQGSKQVMVGIGTGLVLGLILTQVLSSLFASLSWVFAINLAVAAVMAGVGLLSVALPALESARVEAQNALRE